MYARVKLSRVWALMSNSPAEFLKIVIGKQVQVRLHSDLEYRGTIFDSTKLTLSSIGILVCLDGYMNIALENAQEWSQGIPQQSFSDIFIRGNNGKNTFQFCMFVYDLFYLCSSFYKSFFVAFLVRVIHSIKSGCIRTRGIP